MIERRRFLTLTATGILAVTTAAIVPDTVAHAGVPASPLAMTTWMQLVGSPVAVIDENGQRFPMTVVEVIYNRVGNVAGDSFSVVLRARSRAMTDALYRVGHRSFGGSTTLFLTGNATTSAVLVVNTSSPAGTS